MPSFRGELVLRGWTSRESIHGGSAAGMPVAASLLQTVLPGNTSSPLPPA